MKRIHSLFLATIGLVVFSGGVAASTCSSALSSYNNYMLLCNQGDHLSCSSADSIRFHHPECFYTPSAEVAAQDNQSATSMTTINATAFTQAVTISNAISTRLSSAALSQFITSRKTASLDEGKGMAAGGTPNPWSVWANIDQNDSSYRYTTDQNIGMNGKTDVTNAVFGVDYLFSPQFVFGLSGAIDNSDGHMSFNQVGQPVVRTNLDNKGWMLSPYLAWQINRLFALDVAVGMGKGKSTWKNAQFEDKADADRKFAALNLSYTNQINNWQLLGKMSYLYGEEDYSSVERDGVEMLNSKTKNTLDQIRLGMQAGYVMGGFMPYAAISYANNIRRTSDIGKDYLGRDTFIATAGLNFFSASNRLSGGIYYSQELNRKHSDNETISANINFRF